MDILQLLIWIIGSFTGLGVLIAGAGYGYGQFKKGQKSFDDETINSMQRQLDTFIREMEELKRENKEYVAINNQLQGQLQTYKEIATLQDPEFKKVIKALADTVPLLVKSVQYCQSKQTK